MSQQHHFRRWFLNTTKTSPEHDNNAMTDNCSSNYVEKVMKGLQHTNAFVVQFRRGAQAGKGQLSGRVEHVASGRTATFQTLEELPAVLLSMLENAAAEQENAIG